MTCPETICLEALNPKVQGSTPCASTIMLCPRVSGRVSGVPDMSTVGGPLAAKPPLTAYLTAYGLRNRLPNCGGPLPALNSGSALLTDSNRAAANQESHANKPSNKPDVLATRVRTGVRIGALCCSTRRAQLRHLVDHDQDVWQVPAWRDR